MTEEADRRLAPTFVTERWIGGDELSRRRRGPFDVNATVPPMLTDAEFSFGAAVAAKLETAAAAIRDLNASGLENLEALAVPLLRAESVASSRIESLRVSHRGVTEALEHPQHAVGAAREVANNVRAMRDAIAAAAKGPIDRGAIRSIHATLLANTGDRRHAGKERTVQNWIGPANIRDAVYVPPPPRLVGALLDDLVRFAARTDLPAIAQAALVHAQFEGIHPFVDGNGRVGRCLVHAQLHRRGVATRLVPPLSTVLLAERDRYYRDLAAWQKTGDPEPIMHAFADAAVVAARHAGQLAQRLAEMQLEWASRVGRLRADSVTRRLIAALPAHPLLTVQSAATALDVAPRVALRGIDQLSAAGVLRLVDENRRRDRAWFADDVFDALDEFEASVARDTGERKVVPTRHRRAR